DLEQVILKCLRKERSQRYQNVAALAVDLAYFAPDAGPRSAERISKVLSSGGVSHSELTSSSITARNAASNTGASQAWGTTQTTRSNGAVWLGIAGVVLALVIGVVVWKATSAAPGASRHAAGKGRSRAAVCFRIAGHQSRAASRHRQTKAGYTSQTGRAHGRPAVRAQLAFGLQASAGGQASGDVSRRTT